MGGCTGGSLFIKRTRAKSYLKSTGKRGDKTDSQSRAASRARPSSIYFCMPHCIIWFARCDGRGPAAHANLFTLGALLVPRTPWALCSSHVHKNWQQYKDRTVRGTITARNFESKHCTWSIACRKKSMVGQYFIKSIMGWFEFFKRIKGASETFPWHFDSFMWGIFQQRREGEKRRSWSVEIMKDELERHVSYLVGFFLQKGKWKGGEILWTDRNESSWGRFGDKKETFGRGPGNMLHIIVPVVHKRGRMKGRNRFSRG